MPDAALDRTERQFFALLDAAAPDLLVRVSFFSLSGVARCDTALEHLRRHSYRSASELPSVSLDAMIVTGAEPRLSDLRLEAYWTELARLFDWVAADGPATLFSCLAAHAAVLHYDGIERQRLCEKRSGLFDHVVAGHDFLTQSLAAPIRVAHSRWNELCESTLAACGYRILTWAPEAGVDLFIKRGRDDLLFCQGHPEYDPASLAREYHRDVRRFLTRESETYPSLPKHYFEPAEADQLVAFRERARNGRSEALMMEFPAACRRREERWQPPAASVFRSWLRQIVETKRRRRSRPQVVAAPMPVLARAS